MRRLIAILLLFALPFQALWAAAEPYCLHEHGASLHVGHHVHDHADDRTHGAHAAHGEADQADQPGDADQDAAKAMADHDHHCCATWGLMAFDELGLTQAPMPPSFNAGPVLALRSVDGGHIDRPNWPASR